MYEIKYLTKGISMCGADFKRTPEKELINLNKICSVSNIKRFYLPLSGTYVDDYATISMQNSDTFFITKTEYLKILPELPKT